MQLGPVRWNFIKSPSPRIPYRTIRKLLEVELANTKANKLSDLEIEQKIITREKTKRIVKQKMKEEFLLRLIIIATILLISTIAVYLTLKK